MYANIVQLKMRGALGLLAALLAAALAVSVASAAPGDHHANLDFNLDSSNSDASGITYDGMYVRVVDDDDQKVYAYSLDGTYVPAQNLNLDSGNDRARGFTYDGTHLQVVEAGSNFMYTYRLDGTFVSLFPIHADNSDPYGIAYDGTYLRVVDRQDTKVYTYSLDGTYVPAQNLDLDSDNTDPRGIAYDGTYLRVVDQQDTKVYTYSLDGTYVPAQNLDLDSDNSHASGIIGTATYLRVVDRNDNKVYTYEGLAASTTNYGLSDDVEYQVGFSATVVAYDDWRCARSETGNMLRINNVRLTLHGFCAQPKDADGIEVEIHLGPAAEYADLEQLANVTGEWWYVETGLPANLNYRIYSDNDPIGFSEERGGLEDSDRLGFATHAKTIEDADCAEEADGEGFACDRQKLTALSTGDDAVLLIALTEDNTITSADTPEAPDSPSLSRSADYTEATLQWELYDAVTQYEIERLTAVQVSVSDAARIEYGDPAIYRVTGTQAGIDEYVDSTVESNRTYQYRIRARGTDGDSWSDWSDYAYTGAKPGVEIEPPGNLELDRDAESVMVSWTAPVDEFDNYTLQRQEMVVVQDSTFFANVITLGGNDWLPGSSTTYTDTNIIPTQIYEYRIAAVRDDQVGTYSDWFRVGPPNTSLGESPSNFKFLSSRVLDDRREFWMAWDDVPGSDDYEVQLLLYDVASGGQSMEERIVTDSTYFHTSYGRVGLRVRGRKLDTVICDSSPDDRCLTEWTGWYEVRFTPTVTIPSPVKADDTADASIMALRTDTEELLEAVLEPAGGTVDGAQVIQFLVVVTAVLVGGGCVALSWRRGMAPLGVGMGAAIMILVLFVGYRLFGTPLAWAVAAQALVAVAGLFALVRQTGVFR